MKYRNGAVIAMVACLGAGFPALARAQVSASPTCPVENAQVSVSFNGTDQDVSVVRSKVDAKIAEIRALGAEQHFTKFIQQSLNYNISTNYNGGDQHFQYSGNVSFSILPADKAADFMEILAKKGYQANLNVNSYNNGNCMRNMEK
jgi:UTP:GlnB (protein PII) uridylyltransferase